MGVGVGGGSSRELVMDGGGGGASRELVKDGVGWWMVVVVPALAVFMIM